MTSLRVYVPALLALVLVLGPGVSVGRAQTDSPLVGSRYDPRLTFKLLSTNPTGEIIMATPAISEGVIFIRTAKQIVAAGK